MPVVQVQILGEHGLCLQHKKSKLIHPPTMHYPPTYYQPTINQGHIHLHQTVSNHIMENTKLHTTCLDVDGRQCGGEKWRLFRTSQISLGRNNCLGLPTHEGVVAVCKNDQK